MKLTGNLCVGCGHDSALHCFHAHSDRTACCTHCPGGKCAPLPRMVLVYDVDADKCIEVTAAEAAAGMVRYARSLGPGTPACGEVERQALALLRGNPVP